MAPGLLRVKLHVLSTRETESWILLCLALVSTSNKWVSTISREMFPFCQPFLLLQLDEKQLTFWILHSLMVSNVRIPLRETAVLL